MLFAEGNKLLYWKTYVEQHTHSDMEKSLHHAARWLIHSIKSGATHGSGTYYWNTGWTSGYPETTGYIIDTLVRYSKDTKAPWSSEAKEASSMALHWLLSIQHEDGGWPGGYVHQNRPSVVFNTGQILRGMFNYYSHCANEEERQKILSSVRKAIHWIWNQLDEEGKFSRNDFMGAIRVYGTYVVAPILQWVEVFPNEKEAWEKHARVHLDWVLSQQSDSSWFANCDNTLHKNHKPIIHTLAYTIDGMWDCGVYLNDEKYKASALKAATVLRDLFLEKGILKGRYDQHWKGSEAFIPTGGAQLAIVWHKMACAHEGDLFAMARSRMNLLLSVIATRGARESIDTAGAITGSFPLWGRYEPFALPNWATKYLADSLMNELNEGNDR
jgi:hypothetical protein